MPAIGIATVLLRFYTRRKMKNRILLDDWLLIPALVRLSIIGRWRTKLDQAPAAHRRDGRQSRCRLLDGEPLLEYD
ncbi:MAG: hypothetical protein L6R36_008487 [Xanthoria steineri]|nr:MAG: hypothetical protein L6R36_008487 [Xanthoria steineri]